MPFDIAQLEKRREKVAIEDVPTPIAPKEDIPEISSILYGEGANDREGWPALLNTYNKARRKDESLLNAMRRKSAASYTKSKQYTKASTGDLNAYEQKVFNDIQNSVTEFKPDENWPYTFHENLDFYSSEEEAHIKLQKAWGADADLSTGKKIGKETYFAPPKKESKEESFDINSLNPFQVKEAQAAEGFNLEKFNRLKSGAGVATEARGFDPYRFEQLKRRKMKPRSLVEKVAPKFIESVSKFMGVPALQRGEKAPSLERHFRERKPATLKAIETSAKAIRWIPWRALEHPISTLTTELQMKEKGVPIEAPKVKELIPLFKRAFQSWIPFHKVPEREEKFYGDIGQNYYKALTGKEAPAWYEAMWAVGLAVNIEAPMLPYGRTAKVAKEAVVRTKALPRIMRMRRLHKFTKDATYKKIKINHPEYSDDYARALSELFAGDKLVGKNRIVIQEIIKSKPSILETVANTMEAQKGVPLKATIEAKLPTKVPKPAIKPTVPPIPTKEITEPTPVAKAPTKLPSNRGYKGKVIKRVEQGKEVFKYTDDEGRPLAESFNTKEEAEKALTDFVKKELPTVDEQIAKLKKAGVEDSKINRTIIEEETKNKWLKRSTLQLPEPKPTKVPKVKYEYRDIASQDYNIKRPEYKLPYSDKDLETLMNPEITKNINSIKKQIFDETGTHLTITNALRTKEYNEFLSKKDEYEVDEDSEHLYSNAIDVIFRDKNGKNLDWEKIDEEIQTKIMKAIRKHGLLPIDAYEKHLHIETSSTKKLTTTMESRYKEMQLDKQTVGALFPKKPLPEHLQKIVDKQKGIKDVTPKGFGPTKAPIPKAVDIPSGWSVAVQPNWRRPPGWRSEVDWKDKRIVFETAADAKDVDIINHEIAHILLEDKIGYGIRELSDSPFLEEYAEISGEKIGVHVNFIREHAAMDYGEYLTNPSKVSVKLKTLFAKHFPEAKKPTKAPPGALGFPKDLGAPPILRGIDTFEGVKAGSKQAELRLFEEVKKIAKKYAGIIGEKYVPRKFLGIHWGDTGNIFVNALNNLSTTIHEVTHAIDSKRGIYKKIMRIKGYSKDGKPIYASETKGMRKELTKAYLEFYPKAQATHKLEKRVREGVAVFIQNCIAQPTAMTAKYPLLYKEFLQGGEYYDQMLPDMVKDARNVIGAYQRLDPLKKVGSKVLSDDQPVIRDSYLKFRERVITFLADNIYPIEKMAREAGVQWTNDDPSLWTRLYNNISGIVNRNINTNKGFVHFKNEELRKLYDFNWRTLIDGLSKDMLTDDFAYWLVARREHFGYKKLDELKKEVLEAAENAKRLKEQGVLDTVQGKQEMFEAKKVMDDYQRLASILKNDGFSREVVDSAYNQYKDQFKVQAEQFDKLVRADLDFLRDVGMVSGRNYEEFIKNEGYATFKRDVYNEVVGEGREVSPVTRVSKKVSALKGRTGSQLTIVNPLYSSIKNHSEIMRKGLKQLVNNKIYNLRSHFPDFMQKIPLTKVPRGEGRFEYPQDRDPNILMAISDGKRLPLLVSKEIMTVINELLTFKSIHIFEKLAIKASRLFTKGTTGLYPPFAIQNFFVDQITASAQTTTNYKPVISQLNVLWQQLQGHSKNAEYLQEYLMLGGQRHTFVGWLDMNPNEFFTVLSKEKNIIQKAGDLVEQGTDIIALPVQASEILTRSMEYINSRNAGDPQIVALEKAGRVTAPFHHVGTWGGPFGKTLVKSIPYFNASVEVLAQFSRTLKNPKTRSRAVFVVMALTAASVAGYLAIMTKGTKEQQDLYKDIHPRELAHYIFFPSPDGKTLLRFRVPEQMSAFGTLINMAMANVYQDARFRKEEFVDAATSWIPDQFNVTDPVRVFFAWMPHAIGTTTEVLMNRRTYPKVMPIEGMNMERHEARFRYNDRTGWLAKYLGSRLNLSPKKIDYLIEGMLGRTTKFIKGGKITNPIVREAYFGSGRRLVEFYELRKANDQAFDSWKNKSRDFTSEEKKELFKTRAQIKMVSNLLTIYRKKNVENKKDPTIPRLRERILNRIDSIKYVR